MKNEECYTQFALVREMMETPEILRNFKLKSAVNRHCFLTLFCSV